MKKKGKLYSIKYLWPLLVLAMLGDSRAEGTLLSVQSTARPFGLDIVGEVYEAQSDADSLTFQLDYLPDINDIVQENLSESMALTSNEVSSLALDSSKLSLAEDSDVRVYFVGEGAGYHNTLGFNTSGGGATTGNPLLIFPDSSASGDYLDPSAAPARTQSAPLLAGDFVELGNLSSGTNLDFFLIGNGANGGNHVYSTDESVNPDGIQHVISFAVENTSYLLIGFEDLYNGGDLDFNDLLFIVDIGVENVQALVETIALVPEPAEVVMMFIVIITLLVAVRVLKTSESTVEFS